MTLKRVGFALCVTAAAICLVLHVATFVAILSPVWILPGFVLIFGAVACATAVQPRRRFSTPTGKVAIAGYVLLIYAMLTFVYFYRTTGGASSVGVVDGQYVSMYKSHVIRTITVHEYRMFPNLWTRVMTAWIAMMAVFCSTSFKLSFVARSDQAV
jgi:hypothetical protein